MTRHLHPVEAPQSAVKAAGPAALPPKGTKLVRKRLVDRETIGVDPGEQATGLALRDGHACIDHDVVLSTASRGPRDKDVTPDYDYLRAVQQALGRLITASRARTGLAPDLAIEGLRAPTGHLGIINTRTLISAGIVLGAVLNEYGHGAGAGLVHRIVVVPPGGHGSQPVGAYPEQLASAAERRRGPLHVAGGNLRHARSAFDVAGAARHPAFTSRDAQYGP